MNIDRKVIEQALDELEAVTRWRETGIGRPPEQTSIDVITALREALAQPQPVQEPVAHCELTKAGSVAFFDGRPMVMVGPVGNDCHPQPLYTSPQAQPLSEERVREIYESTTGLDFYRNFARAIEQAHGITKGTT